MFISAILIVFKFLFRCSYFNRSWPVAFRDGRFLIAFTTSCIVNGSVDGSDWGCEGSISIFKVRTSDGETKPINRERGIIQGARGQFTDFLLESINGSGG